MKKEQLTSLLWQEFKESVKSNWANDYQRLFGDIVPLHEMEQPFNFARAIHKKAEQRFARERIDIAIVSADTIHNALQKDGLSPKSKNKSLDFFAAFAGYKNWKEFEMTARHRQKQNKKIKPPSAVQSKPSKTLPPPPVTENSKLAWKKYTWLILLPPLLYFLYFQYQRSTIVRLIYQVNEAEFAAYAAIPEVDTTYFDALLTSSANSRLIVRNIVLNSIEQRKYLEKSSSYHDVNDITINSLWWTTAKVTTAEQWDLRWHDADTGRFMTKYDQINTQDYHLKYVDGDWMIDANVYEGQKSNKE